MNLKSKLVAPLLVGGMIFMCIIYLYWGPSLLQDKRTQLQQQGQNVLSILGESVVPSLISGDMAQLHATLDLQMQGHQQSWKQLSLFNPEGKRLYPLFLSDMEWRGEGLISLEHNVLLDGEVVAFLVLIMDIEPALEKERKRMTQLNIFVILIMFCMSALSLLWFHFIIVKPLIQLQAAAKKLADGDYDHKLKAQGDDEVAALTRVFELMRNKLLQSNEDLNDALILTRESEVRQKTVLENMADGVITLNSQWIVVSTNLAVEQIFGYRADEMLGMPLLSLLRGKGEIAGDLLDKMDDESVYLTNDGLMEVDSVKADGEHIIIEWAFKAMMLNGEQMFTAIVRDISERKRVEKMKSEFISTVSHELRTPLTSIRGSLGLVNGGVLGEIPEKAHKMLVLAHNNVERLTLLINDILDMQKIEAGEMDFNLFRQDLVLLLEQSVSDNFGYAEQHKVKFTFFSHVEDAWVLADAIRLNQVMSNLLSNAAKFSPEGAEVKVELRQSSNRIQITVTDCGAGIPAEFHDKLFMQFTQHDASDTRGAGGTGLGLSITKVLVEKHHGTIDFISEEGVGTTFIVELPLVI